MAAEQHDTVRAVAWQEGRLLLLDQRRLPGEETVLELDSAAAVADAIAGMAVRGAPAIGIAAAYGTVLAVRRRLDSDGPRWRERFDEDLERLGRARPTAINLRWAIERMRRVLESAPGDPHAALLAEAEAIHAEDVAANRAMGALGASLLNGPARAVLTHCNTGSLATGGFGTALGVIRRAYADGRIERVYADETRPWLQGSRLTAWELARDGIPATLLCEGAAASLLAGGEVGWVIVGADRVTANGDVANKIGTYGLAIAARHHGVRFMVVAPTSTVDRAVADGRDIPIEQRPAAELLDCRGRRIAAAGVDAWNPAFDVTPAALVDALVTERGVASPPTPAAVAALFAA